MKKMKQMILLALAAVVLADVTSFGYNLNNNRFSSDTTFNTGNANQLKLKYAFTTHGDVSATPAVATIDGVKTIFFPDWAGMFIVETMLTCLGYLYAVNQQTGNLIWSVQLSALTGRNSASRGTPAVSGNTLVVGDANTGLLLGINALNGGKLWSTLIDTHPLAEVSGSATIYNGAAFIGVASREEGWNQNPGYQCCSFRGSLVKVNVANGAIIWKRYLTPAGYSGAGVWGSAPPIDTARGLVFATTGNSYKVPQSVNDCYSHGGGLSCSPGNFADSIGKYFVIRSTNKCSGYQHCFR
jgi:polyvinyl alcohol dehydrogenase (cytochrome)